ncbi:MAG: hypothetical protein HKN29_04885 [Rhodothermales bacterium]|nr:hypothetical protein [Rhodothermales bacterium]
MSRSFVTAFFLALAALLAMPSESAAQRIGVHTGLNFDGTDLMFGGQAQFGINLGERDAIGQVGFDIYPLIKDTFVSRVNVNVLFDLLASAGAEIYGGGGLMVQMSRFDVPEGVNIDETDTDFGINLVGGIVLSGADRRYRPFVELNQTIGGGTGFAVRGGVFLKLTK